MGWQGGTLLIPANAYTPIAFPGAANAQLVTENKELGFE